jgi:hypothetical protein
VRTGITGRAADPTVGRSFYGALRYPSRLRASSIVVTEEDFEAAWDATAAFILLIVALIGLMMWPLGLVPLGIGLKRLGAHRRSPYPLPGRAVLVTAVILGLMEVFLTALAVVALLLWGFVVARR